MAKTLDQEVVPAAGRIALCRRGAGKISNVAVVLSTIARGIAPLQTVRAQSIEALQRLSVEDLANIEISSVSKTAEPLSEATASVYVITQEDIQHSGAIAIPEILRLAPNLQIGQAGAQSYAISARGFNGTLANKLLVLIDGRSVYTPLYGGVYWDMQTVMPADIDRVEVISGPGATLWGANAVNGVINIITKKSSETQDIHIEAGAGNLAANVSAQFDGRLNDNLTYRVYGMWTEQNALTRKTGINAHEGWYLPQGGFRADWNPGDDVVTLQGDFYRGSEEQFAAVNKSIAGHNVLARWQHQMDGGSQLQVKAYYDRAQRFSGAGGGGYVMETYDLDVQHSFAIGSWNAIVWGGGGRIAQYQATNNFGFGFLPDHRTLDLSNIFVQDSISIAPSLKLTAGMKLENDPYSGAALLPSARLAWKVSDSALLWSAISRAVRAPTPYDRDVFLKVGGALFLKGGSRFQSEKMTAYEIGTRIQASPDLSFSISGFYNVYDDLKSTEPTPVTIFPVMWGNKMEGETYGLEAWGTYRAASWWRLSAGFNVLQQDLRFRPSSSRVGGLEQAGNDPEHWASIRSTMDIADGVTFDLDMRQVGALPNPKVPAYAELDARIAWTVTPFVTVLVTGSNLLHDQHLEFGGPPAAVNVPRSFYVNTRWKF